MAVELEFDLRGEGRRFRQRMWRIYRNQLNEYGRRQVGDFEQWAAVEEKAWRAGKRAGTDYDEWVERTNYVPEFVARAERERADFVGREIRELEFAFGSTYQRLREEPGMREVADRWWGNAVQRLRDGRVSTAWGLMPDMANELQQINGVLRQQMQQRHEAERVRLESLHRGVNPPKG